MTPLHGIAAIHSISTNAPIGRADTPMHVRAGILSYGKNCFVRGSCVSASGEYRDRSRDWSEHIPPHKPRSSVRNPLPYARDTLSL